MSILFSETMPVQAFPAGMMTSVRAPGGVPRPGVRRIVVVGDMPLADGGAEALLARAVPGAAAVEALSLGHARDLCRAFGADLLLLDLDAIVPPDASVLAALVRDVAPVPVLLLAADASPGAVRAAVSTGARGLLPKSAGPEALEHAIALVLTGVDLVPLPRLPHGRADGIGLSPTDRLKRLTARQREIYDLLREGRSNKEMARLLGMREGTVKVHVRTILQKLDVHNRTQAALLGALLP